MKDMILFPEDIDRLNLILEQLISKANLLLAVLVNKDGRLLTYQGTIDKIDTVSMAALIAGNSASTLAIAHLMGETEFSSMYHQGKDKHIFIEVVDDNTFLCLVFDERTNIDRVKVFARQFDRQLKSALKLVYEKSEEDIDLDADMGPSSTTQVSGHGSTSTTGYASKSDVRTSGGEEIEFFRENKDGIKKENQNIYDTNYLYLKKKIQETVKRKKEE